MSEAGGDGPLANFGPHQGRRQRRLARPGDADQGHAPVRARGGHGPFHHWRRLEVSSQPRDLLASPGAGPGGAASGGVAGEEETRSAIVALGVREALLAVDGHASG